MKIDTSGWKEFKLVDLFTYERGTRLTKNNRAKGKYPLVTAGEYNKGIKEYINNENQKIFNNAITIDMFCNSFVHIDNFCCDDNVIVLNSKQNISRYAMQFISAIINQDKEKWGYGKQYRQNSLEKHKIFLPIYKNGNPDWEYMENTIKATEQKIINIIKKYEFKRNFINNKLLYKDFKLGDLFKIKSNPQLNKNSFEFLDGGEYPYFTRTVYNNGILGYVKYLDEEHKIKGNSIAVGLIAMQFFYMEKDFYAGQFTKTIYPRFDNFNKNIAHYFIAILNKNKNKYLNDFIVKYFERDFKNTMVSLPVNKKGIPDFELMENFIKQIEKENNSLLKMIRKVK